MKTTVCDAVVLAAMDYGEADRILTLFTREQGKVRAIARHGKKSARRFGGALEVFVRLRAHLVLKEGLSSLREAESVEVFPQIRTDLLKIGYAGYACELVDRLLPEAMDNQRLFRLLICYLEQLASYPPCADDRRFFEVNLLNILGYRLSLEECCRCGARVDTAPARCDSSGEIFCGTCGGGGLPLGPVARGLLRKSIETGRFGLVRFPEDSLVEAGAVLDAALATHLARPLRSLQFLHEVLGVH